MPEVGRAHPRGVEPAVRIGAEPQVLAQRAVDRERDTAPPLHVPGGETRFSARHEVADRVGPAAVEAEAVSTLAPAGCDPPQLHASLVAAEGVRAGPEAERPATENVGPAQRPPRGDERVPPGPL